MMTADIFSSRSHRLLAAVLVAASLALGSVPARAAVENKEAGVKMLKAELPKNTTIKEATCDVLTEAVARAVAAHKKAAPAILNAALYNGDLDDSLRKEDRRVCECVLRIVYAAVMAAPAEGNDLLEVAIAAYPDCANGLAGMLRDTTDAKDRPLVRGPQSSDPTDQPVAGINNLPVAGFNSGLGDPGSPGSPNFGGSMPSTGVALPPPAGTAVTQVGNQ